jgi:hypothetical protein
VSEFIKVRELIEELKKYDPEADLAATWEGIVRGVTVYQSKDGVVLIDADSGFYRDDFVSGRHEARDP